jgi:hypothetical protein
MNFENNIEPGKKRFEEGVMFEVKLDDFYDASGVVLEGGEVLDVRVMDEDSIVEKRFSLNMGSCQTPEEVMELIKKSGREAMKTNPDDIKSVQRIARRKGGNPIDPRYGAGGSASL